MIFPVVITYCAPEKLKSCLAALNPELIPHKDYSPYIVDNSPPGENLLYTKGINTGIRRALTQEAKYILIVCDDVIIRPGAVAAMATYLDENEDCAIAMPIQIGKSGEVTCGGCTKAFPVGWHITEPLGSTLYSAPYESYWANGACFLLRAEAVTECGLLDENMKFICSDSDYSFTLRSRGWKIFVVPNALVEHDPDGAVHYKNPMLERQKDEDSLYFVKKWLTGGLFQELAQEGATVTASDIMSRVHILRQRLAVGYGK